MAPEKENPASGGGPGFQVNSNSTDSAIVANGERRRRDRITAELARCGHTLHETTDGTFIVAKWGLTRELNALDDAERWAEQVTGARV